MAEGSYVEGGVQVEVVAARPVDAEPRSVWLAAISALCDRSEISTQAATAASSVAVVAVAAAPSSCLPPLQSSLRPSQRAALASTGAHFEAVVQVAGQDIAMHEVVVRELCRPVDQPVQHGHSLQPPSQQQQQPTTVRRSAGGGHGDGTDTDSSDAQAAEEQRRAHNRAMQAHFQERQARHDPLEASLASSLAYSVAELQRAQRELEKLAAQYAQQQSQRY